MQVDTMLLVFSFILVFMLGYQLGYGRYRRALRQQQKALEGMRDDLETLEDELGELYRVGRDRPPDGES